MTYSESERIRKARWERSSIFLYPIVFDRDLIVILSERNTAITDKYEKTQYQSMNILPQQVFVSATIQLDQWYD